MYFAGKEVGHCMPGQGARCPISEGKVGKRLHYPDIVYSAQTNIGQCRLNINNIEKLNLKKNRGSIRIK